MIATVMTIRGGLQAADEETRERVASEGGRHHTKTTRLRSKH